MGCILIGKKDLSDKEADLIREIFRETGSLDYSIRKCQEQVDKAKIALRKLANKNDSDAFHFLIGIADYMIIRSL